MFSAAGITAVLAVTGPFMQEYLGLSIAMIGMVLLLAQIAGIFGAFVFHKYGSQRNKVFGA